jgi:hypothetical protein
MAAQLAILGLRAIQPPLEFAVTEEIKAATAIQVMQEITVQVAQVVMAVQQVTLVLLVIKEMLAQAAAVEPEAVAATVAQAAFSEWAQAIRVTQGRLTALAQILVTEGTAGMGPPAEAQEAGEAKEVRAVQAEPEQQVIPAEQGTQAEQETQAQQAIQE